MTTAAPAIRRLAGKNAPSSFTWRTLVLMETPQRNVESHSANVTYARFDGAHKPLPALGLLAQWSEDFGWHRSLAGCALLPQTQILTAPVDIAQAGVAVLAKAELANTSTAESLATIEQQTTATESTARLNKMLVEAAHDIRSPIAVAQQILSTLAGRIQRSGQLLSDECELLEEANVRLTQANRWAEGILVEQGLQHGLPVNIRRRFYPHQWLAEIQPLLQSLASQRQVRLTWQGWDRSLPRLYADPNLLSRAVLNLVSNALAASSPNQEVRVRAAWQNDAIPRFSVRVEDSGSGLPVSLIRQLNSRANWATGEASGEEQGIGLRTVKSLVSSLGGNLYAKCGAAGGTCIDLWLPIDQPSALLRSWLLQLTSAEGIASPKPQRMVMHAIRNIPKGTQTNDSVQRIDNCLQRSAGSSDFVYRVAADRWLWLGLLPQAANSTAPDKLLKALQLLPQLATASGAQYDCRHQPVFQIDGLRLSRWFDRTAGTSRGSNSLSFVVELIAAKIGDLTAHHLPPLDELSKDERSLVFQSVNSGRERVIRTDQAHSSSLNSSVQLISKVNALQTATQQQPGIAGKSSAPDPTAFSVARLDSLAETPCDAFSGALAELTQQWHASHNVLARGHNRLSPVE